MAKDVLITPGSGTIEFIDTTVLKASIYELNGALCIGKSGEIVNLNIAGVTYNYVIPDTTVTNAKLANMVANTIKGRITSAGAPQDLTAANVRTIINVADGANNYIHPTTDGNLHVPATGTTNDGKVLKAGATAGSISWGTLTKTDVGLGNIDNTSDLNKPISTATQTALDTKQATITGAASTIATANVAVNLVLISNGSGKVAVSSITSTELGHLDGVTSNIQTQLDGKSVSTHTHTLATLTDTTITSPASGEILKYNGTVWINNTLSEAGIAAASHTHSYLPLSGGTLTGAVSGTTFSGISFNSITGLASTNPLINGTVAVGTATTVARADHVHPVDTSRAAASHTHTRANITDLGTVAAINTNASTANYLRGDGTWVTPPNTTHNAGVGLTLTATTFALGTPSTITASTTNSVTGTTHTHDITGFLPLSGGTLTGTMLFPDGTVSAPSIAFANDIDTGIYRKTTNTLAITTGGTEAVYFDGSGNTNINGVIAIGEMLPNTSMAIYSKKTYTANGDRYGTNIQIPIKKSELTDNRYHFGQHTEIINNEDCAQLGVGLVSTSSMIYNSGDDTTTYTINFTYPSTVLNITNISISGTSSIQNTGIATVTLTTSTMVPPGADITVSGNTGNCNGTRTVLPPSSNGSFTFYMEDGVFPTGGNGGTVTILAMDSIRTVSSISNITISSLTVTVTTTAAHNLRKDSRVTIAGRLNSTNINGTDIVVVDVLSTTKFTFTAPGTPVAGTSGGTITPTKMYVILSWLTSSSPTTASIINGIYLCDIVSDTQIKVTVSGNQSSLNTNIGYIQSDYRFSQSMYGSRNIIQNGHTSCPSASLNLAIGVQGYIINNATTLGKNTINDARGVYGIIDAVDGVITNGYACYGHISIYDGAIVTNAKGNDNYILVRNGGYTNYAAGTHNYIRCGYSTTDTQAEVLKGIGTRNYFWRRAGTFTEAIGVENEFFGTIGTTVGFFNTGNPQIDLACYSGNSLKLGHYDPATLAVTTRLEISADNILRVYTDRMEGPDYIKCGIHSTGNRYSFIDFIGDDTYTDYGLRLLRGNGGANTYSNLYHRGTGSFRIGTIDAGNVEFKTSNAVRAYFDAIGSPVAGSFVISNSSPNIKFADTTASAHPFWLHSDSNSFYILTNNTGTTTNTWNAYPLQLRNSDNTGLLYGSKIWTISNHGDGSGLHADLLDGVHANNTSTVNTIPVRGTTIANLQVTGRSAGWGSHDTLNTGGINVALGIDASTSATWLITGTSNVSGTQTFRGGIQLLDSGSAIRQIVSSNLLSVSAYAELYSTGRFIVAKGGAITPQTGYTQLFVVESDGTATASTFNATSTTNGGFQGIATDTVTAPSFTWTGDLNTGMYRLGTDQIGFALGGVSRFELRGAYIKVLSSIEAGPEGAYFAFNAYYDTTWKNRTNDECWAIHHGGTNLNIKFNAAVAAGTDLTSTLTDKFVFNSNGDFTANRYVIGSYMNMTHGPSTRTTDDIFYSSTDSYIRKNTKDGFIASLALDTRYLSSGGGTLTGGLLINQSTGNAYIKLGNPNLANTPFIDFRTGNGNTDFTCRIIADHGTVDPGAGRFTYIAAEGHVFQGPLSVQNTIDASMTTAYLFNTTATTIYAFGAATTLSIGASTGTTTINNFVDVKCRLRTNGNISATAWSYSGMSFDSSAATLTDTSTLTGGTIAVRVANSFGRPTLDATNTGITIADAATLYIGNSPLGTARVTITNPWSLFVDNGNCRFDGNIVCNGTYSGNGSGLTALDATQLTTGIVPNARMTGTYSGITVKLDGTNTVYTTPSTGSTNVLGRTVFGLCEYRSGSGTVGAIVFMSPTTMNNGMYYLELDGYIHTTNGILKYLLHGYRSSTTVINTLSKVSLGNFTLPNV